MCRFPLSIQYDFQFVVMAIEESLVLPVGTLVVSLLWGLKILSSYASKDTSLFQFVMVYCGMALAVTTFILLPYDICFSRTNEHTEILSESWTSVYWVSFTLCWIAYPIMLEYESVHSIKKALRNNAIWYLAYACAGLLILAYLWYMQRLGLQGILGFIYAASNAWGLVLVTLLLGYGLVAVPQWLHVLSYDKRHMEAIYAQVVSAEDVIKGACVNTRHVEE